MTTSDSEYTMALFCDFENVALGVRDAKIPKFDMKLVLERLLLKGSIVVKKAYCDWDRYKEFKGSMHETAFELIEIPHTRMSGKNSADIRMVVDALDLCYTKEHIDTFVIISGDSDFSPLVSKLRENAKTVIGVGVKNSTSDLLMNNCDEFIYYDDLARAIAAPTPRRKPPAPKKPAVATEKPAVEKPAVAAKAPAAKPASAEDNAALEAKEAEAIDMVVKLAEELIAERGGQVWSSMVKQTLKRRKPGFNESFYGFRSFSEVLEEAEDLGLLELELDDRSGGYIVRTVPSGD